MARRDLLGCVVWLGVSLYVCYLSLSMGIGKFKSPGPGFFPFWAAVMMGAFALVNLVNVHAKRGDTKPADSPAETSRKKTILVVISLLLYPCLLPILGYIVATFLLIGFLFLFLGEAKRYWLKVLGALFVTFASFVVFYVLLDVRLPRGFLGF
jgi:putative tricarboxylic transport membrane protein